MTEKPKKRRKQSPTKTPPVAIYLGRRDEREARLEALNRIVIQHGAANLSELIRRIADGELTITPPDSQ